jgi:hypothetical protein
MKKGRSIKGPAALLRAWTPCLLAACLLGACVPALRTPGVNRIDESATYDLILYGGRFAEDTETVAFLQKEDTGYEFEPYASKQMYKVVKGLSASEALERASSFVTSYSANVQGTTMRSILAPDGQVLGYEVRPLYMPLVYGATDLIYVDYFLRKGNKVQIWIRPFYNRMSDGDGRSKQGQH